DRCTITIEGARRERIRQTESTPIPLPGGARGLAIEKLPVGGPYTITVTAIGKPDDGISFRNILVGDLWVLGGQSNMFGIDVIREELPALPYLNMLNLFHFAKEARWCAGEPPIHRIPEPFAQFTLKSQHPEYTEEQIRAILDRKTPVGGIDCSYFF